MGLRTLLRGAAILVLALDIIPFALAAWRLFQSFLESLTYNEGANLIRWRAEEFAPVALVLLAALAALVLAEWARKVKTDTGT